MHSTIKSLLFVVVVVCLSFLYYPLYAAEAQLVGWAELNKSTFSSGQRSPFFSRAWVPAGSQAVQGFSSVVKGLKEDEFIFLVDNAAGDKAEAACCLLRLYNVKVHFKTSKKNSHYVDVLSHLDLNDQRHLITFPIQADYQYYYNDPENNKLDTETVNKRLLTGADFDPESLVVAKDNTFWIGEEFGPFLLHFDSNGTLLAAPAYHPAIVSLDNPIKDLPIKNVGLSSGFEGLAFDAKSNLLYPILEKPLTEDGNHALRVYTFNVNTNQFLDGYYFYPLDPDSTEVREFKAIDENRFLAIEQNINTKEKQFKKVFLIDKTDVMFGQTLRKYEVADLMHIQDPQDLNNDGLKLFTFPKVTIEALQLLDNKTLVIVNDNNFSEPTEFIKIQLAEALPAFAYQGISKMGPGWQTESIFNMLYVNNTHSQFGWLTVSLYFFIMLYALKNNIVLYKRKMFSKYWLIVALVIAMIGFYRQMNIVFFVTEFVRDILMRYNLYEQRREIQLWVLKGLSISVVLGLILISVKIPQFFKRNGFSFIVLSLLSAYKLIEMVSYHSIDNWLMNSIKMLKAYHGIEIGLLLMLLLSLAFEFNQAIKATRLQSEQSKT